MYWRAENAAAWRAMWSDVQAAAARLGRALPDLTAPEDIPAPLTAHWLRDDLVLSQTCSLPLRTALRDRVTYVGTLDFGLDGPPGFYHSVFVRPLEETPLQSLALNGFDSQSGFVAGLEPLDGGAKTTAYAASAPEKRVTGAHRASLMAVANGEADAAYLDAVTFRICETFDAATARIRVAGRTRPTPGLPLITARATDPALLRQAFHDVFAARPAWIEARALGGLRGFVVLEEAEYWALPVPPPVAHGPDRAETAEQ